MGGCLSLIVSVVRRILMWRLIRWIFRRITGGQRDEIR